MHLLQREKQDSLSVNTKSLKILNFPPHHNNFTSDTYLLAEGKCTAEPKLMHLLNSTGFIAVWPDTAKAKDVKVC